jgi:D-aminopeptidase
MAGAPKARARELDIVIGSFTPGPNNTITDVAGVLVGHRTLISGEGPLVQGVGPVRTGVTVIRPHAGDIAVDPLFAAPFRLNGNGEMTGLERVRESGLLTSSIGLTTTHSVGAVRDSLIAIATLRPADGRFLLPVVGETFDGCLNDVNGAHITADHVCEAFASADGGPVAEGNVGAGTGLTCHGFKGGIGTSSRVVSPLAGTVGVLVQANHGIRDRFTVNGVPVGRLISPDEVPLPTLSAVSGSIIVIVATDIPLLPHQCASLASRTALGIARTGGAGEHMSGDLALAFSTASGGLRGVDDDPFATARFVFGKAIDTLFYAVIEATEEAIVNALLAAETMSGRDGNIAYACPPERLAAVMRSCALP